MELKMTFYNSFTNEYLGDITFSYDRMKAVNGWYSNFWKKFRVGLSNLNSIDKHWVRVKLSTNKPSNK